MPAKLFRVLSCQMEWAWSDLNSSMASSGSGSNKTAPNKTPVRSQKLDRTLKELESAFTDWESLSSTKARAAAVEEDRRKASAKATNKDKHTEQNELEFRKKTKKLLTQLRQQLAELK